MKISSKFRLTLCVGLSVMMTNLPAMAASNAVQPTAHAVMVPTQLVIADLNRAEAEQNLQSFLARQDVGEMLANQGVSAQEVSARIATLSDLEIKDLSNQVHEARAGGDILITILVVVLIIFLIKRL